MGATVVAFSAKNWPWRPCSGSTVYSVFTVLPLYFDYIFLQGIWEKVLLLRRFIHCKHSKNTIFLCVRISIAHLAFIAVDLQFTVFYCTSSAHIFALYICSVLLEKVFLLLGGFRRHNTLFQLFSALLTFFFPISNIVYRRFLLFADLGGMAPAVRRNEIKSAWPHKHA